MILMLVEGGCHWVRGGGIAVEAGMVNWVVGLF